MVQMGVLLTQYHRLLSVAAILDVFETVNSFYEEEGHPPFFRIHVLSDGAYSSGYGQYQVERLEGENRYDLILIPAFANTDMKKAIRDNEESVRWLCFQRRQGAAIASVCTGAFLLAATGLLNNKTATTHVDATGRFAAAFPAVKLQAHAVVTQDQDIYTSGGSTNSFHLLLLLVENYCGREIASMGGIIINTQGVLFVSDYYPGNKIRAIYPSGTVSTMAGDVTSGYTDGAGVAARFNLPYGLALDV